MAWHENDRLKEAHHRERHKELRRQIDIWLTRAIPAHSDCASLAPDRAQLASK